MESQLTLFYTLKNYYMIQFTYNFIVVICLISSVAYALHSLVLTMLLPDKSVYCQLFLALSTNSTFFNLQNNFNLPILERLSLRYFTTSSKGSGYYRNGTCLFQCCYEMHDTAYNEAKLYSVNELCMIPCYHCGSSGCQ